MLSQDYFFSKFSYIRRPSSTVVGCSLHVSVVAGSNSDEVYNIRVNNTHLTQPPRLLGSKYDQRLLFVVFAMTPSVQQLVLEIL